MSTHRTQPCLEVQCLAVYVPKFKGKTTAGRNRSYMRAYVFKGAPGERKKVLYKFSKNLENVQVPIWIGRSDETLTKEVYA